VKHKPMTQRKLAVHSDLLNAIVTDPVADAVRRALQLGYYEQDVLDRLNVAWDHAIAEARQAKRLAP